jgi:hypothetical protein
VGNQNAPLVCGAHNKKFSSKHDFHYKLGIKFILAKKIGDRPRPWPEKRARPDFFIFFYFKVFFRLSFTF